jgi:hypothetical protein
MELEELKNKWKELDKHVKAQDEKIKELTDQVTANKVKSPLAMLRRHCLVSAIFVPFLLPFFFWCYSVSELNCPEWQKMLLYVLTWVFVGFIFVRELYLYFELKSINVGRETALEAMKRVIKFRKHYNGGVLIALVMGMAMLLVMFSSIDVSFAVSGTVGAVIGGIFGAKLYRKYIDAVDEMEKTLSEWMGMMGLLVCVL